MERRYPIELVYRDDHPHTDLKHTWGLAIGGKVMQSTYSTDKELTPAQALGKILAGVEFWGS